MSERRESALASLPFRAPRLAHALREAFERGYSRREFRADLFAGIVVGIVALPLSMALAVASGAPPQHGLYTAVIAGAVIAALGGSPVQVSGPTAAFVALLAPVSARWGLGGLLVASVLAGVLLVIMGWARLGELLQFVPYPVIAGFTAGIAIVIASIQLRDFLGLEIAGNPAHVGERLLATVRALPSLRFANLLIGSYTLAVLLVWPKLQAKVPAPLVALTTAALLAACLPLFVSGFSVDTIATRFSYWSNGLVRHGIPQLPPLPLWPWSLPGPGGQPLPLDLATIRELMGPAVAIAALGAIESLLSAVVADGVAGTKHDPNAELVAQGLGNIVAPFFGGFAATGAIARTATNVRFGARSPIAALIHSLFVLIAMVVLAPALGYLPMASLAALLLVVAWNMSEIRHVVHTLRVAPKSDVMVLLTCLTLTVVFDMVVSVTTGIILAALLFMRRMAEVAQTRLIGAGNEPSEVSVPAGVVVYSIDGPLFFGAAQRAMSTLYQLGGDIRAVVLDLREVPVLDATGLVNLESALRKLHSRGAFVVLCGARKQPRALLARSGVVAVPDRLAMTDQLEQAIQLATSFVESVAKPESVRGSRRSN
jgi:SulP family sulfate permease